MTWQEIKLATLQKMFSSDGNTIDANDDAISEYLNAMPQAANEALQMLATAGRYIRKSTTIETLTAETPDEMPQKHRMSCIIYLETLSLH